MVGRNLCLYLYDLPLCGKERQHFPVLIFAYLVQYLPWVLVPRCTFSYHYFPSVPFVALMLGYTMYCFIGENKKKRWLAFAYCAAAFALFLLFYPVLSGQPVSADYVNDGLKWLKDWVLIY